MCNILIYFCNIGIKHLQHTSEIFETLEIHACNMQFERTISLLLGRMYPRRHVEFYATHRGLHAGEFPPATVNWVGSREMGVSELRPSYRELHASELHTRS
jgi:hypothetical protein